MEYQLAPYALNPLRSKGRLYKSENFPARNEFQHDLQCIIHSASFRRLEYKTQVFVNDKGDHYRTRLTHSIEVSQIGKIIASSLGLSTDLTEVIALAHDLGHPPFGHAGEEELNKIMSERGGFDHNANSLKLITEQEERYFAFDGLNLTWESLEGIVKHNGPLLGKYSMDKEPNKFILEFNKKFDLELKKFASLEAQVAAIADDIAYNVHDLEDGLRANLFNIDSLKAAGFMNEIIVKVEKLASGGDIHRTIHEILRRVLNLLIEDVIENAKKRIKEFNINSFYDVQDTSESIVKFSPEKQHFLNRLRAFLFKNMYRHSQVNRMTYKAKKIIVELFSVYINYQNCLPEKWQNKITQEKLDPYLVVCDYIAGMTDRFAMKEHKQLCNF